MLLSKPAHHHSNAQLEGHLLLELRILLCQLQQHGVIKELGNRHILAHALAPACLHTELSGQCCNGSRLQRPQHHRPVQGVSGDHRPVVKHRLTEGLALHQQQNQNPHQLVICVCPAELACAQAALTWCMNEWPSQLQPSTLVTCRNNNTECQPPSCSGIP